MIELAIVITGMSFLILQLLWAIKINNEVNSQNIKESNLNILELKCKLENIYYRQ